MTKREYRHLVSALHEAADMHQLRSEDDDGDMRSEEAIIEGIDEAIKIIETRVACGFITVVEDGS